MLGEIGEKKPILFPQPSQNTRRPRLFRFVVGAFIALFVFVSGVILWQAYGIWKIQNQAAHMVKSWQDYQDQQYQLALVDTYGGKTPHETLQMYIDAIQKGDYELASKYFILDHQTRESKSFDNSTNEFITTYINLLNEAMKNQGNYSWDKNYFSIDNPIGVSMKIYPSGIWKIVEI